MKTADKKIRGVIEGLMSLIGSGERKVFDLRLEDGPTAWPILLEAAGRDHDLANKTMHALEGRLNVCRGEFFLPWSRKRSDESLIVALDDALTQICDCGAFLDDPEDETLCVECLQALAVDGRLERTEARS